VSGYPFCQKRNQIRHADNLVASAKKLAESLNKNGSKLVGVDLNLVDHIWGQERPGRPNEKVKVHPDKFAGKSFQEKIADLRKELSTKKKAAFIVCKSFLRLFVALISYADLKP
jgi:hypothetical protein